MNKRQAIRAAINIDLLYLQPECPAIEQSKDGVSYPHLRWMVEQIEKDEMSEGKTMRWLGYIQGVLVAIGPSSCTLDQMKDLSRRAAEIGPEVPLPRQRL